MNINILVSLTDPKCFESCTLVFGTLRVGFPTAKVHVTLNGNLNVAGSQYAKFKFAVEACGATLHELDFTVHHGEWIQQTVESAAASGDRPCIILDSDCIFWQSVEHWEFDTALAGYYVPTIFNDFSQCVSFARIHTSLMWIDAPRLVQEVGEKYPNAHKMNGEYCPFNPFMPRVEFVHGVPFFFDSCAALYAAIGGTHFGQEHKACFEHLNSASFFKVMHERMENKEGFTHLHKVLVKTPEQLRGYWGCVDQYYADKHQQALKILDSLDVQGAPALRSLKLLLR